MTIGPTASDLQFIQVELTEGSRNEDGGDRTKRSSIEQYIAKMYWGKTGIKKLWTNIVALDLRFYDNSCN